MRAWTCGVSTDPGRAVPVADNYGMRVNRWLMGDWVKPTLWLACLAPALYLVLAAFTDRLGANPAEALIRALGDWSLRMLVLVLAVTPLRQCTGLSALARWRRMLGLFVFFYASLHLVAYAWLDQGAELEWIAQDVLQRPFIAVGFVTWGLLLLMAITSWSRLVRWMGAARWRRLHRSVYAVAGLAVLHFFWMRAGKNDFAEVALYGSVLGGLLAWRVVFGLRARREQPLMGNR